MSLAENWNDIVSAMTAMSWLQSQNSYIEVQNNLVIYIVRSIEALSTLEQIEEDETSPSAQ